MKKCLIAMFCLILVACGGGGGGGGGSPSVDIPSTPPASSSSSSSSTSSSSGGYTVVNYFPQKIPAVIDGTTYQLETKLYLPQDGKTSRPLFIMTHGRNGPAPAINSNEVNTYGEINNAVAAKGYAVLMVARRGYGNSDGPDSEYLATSEASGIAAAKDLQAVVAYMRTQPGIDPNKIVVAGHSQGGWAALAASTLPMPGVLGTVNISGGVNYSTPPGGNYTQAQNIANNTHASGLYGASAKVPVLFMYAINDYYEPVTVSAYVNAFNTAGGHATSYTAAAPFAPYAKYGGHGFVTVPSLYMDQLMAYFTSIGFTL